MIDKKLNLTKNIVDYLPVVCEYFVKFYGEEYRDVIEKRLDNCTYISYTSEDITKSYLRDLYRKKTDELVEEFFLEIGLENTDFNKEKYFCCYVDFFNRSNINLYKIFKCMESDDYINKNNLVYYLSKFSDNDDLEFGTDEFYKLVDELKKIKPSFDKMLQKFDEFKEKYANYQQYVDSCEKLKKELQDKYRLIYLKEIFEYLDEHDKKLVEDAINSGKHINLWSLNCNGVFCCSALGLKALIDSFSSESSEKLNDEKVSSYIKDNIYQDRIKYFNKLGINLGDNYEDYVKDERCLELMPDVIMVDKFIKIRCELDDKEKEEYIISTSQYQEHLEQIDGLNLIDKNISYNWENILNGITCINPNIIEKDGEIKLYNLLLFSGRRLTDFFDKTLLHELNHLVETQLLEVDGESYVVRSGWDILNCKINDTEENEEKREFEYLNEIINELLCQEVTKMLHDDDIYLFDNKETSRIRGGTSYERSKFLVKDFYDEFKDVIKSSRITGDMDSLYKVVGQDNLLELNDLIREFFEYFSEFKFYSLCDDLRKNLDTDNVRFYNSCIERRNIIFSKMRDKKVDYEISNSFVR